MFCCLRPGSSEESVVILHTGPASRAYNLHRDTGPGIQKDPAVAVLKCLIFEQRTLRLHFALGPANYVAHPDGTFPLANAVSANLGLLKSLLI